MSILTITLYRIPPHILLSHHIKIFQTVVLHIRCNLQILLLFCSRHIFSLAYLCLLKSPSIFFLVAAVALAEFEDFIENQKPIISNI